MQPKAGQPTIKELIQREQEKAKAAEKDAAPEKDDQAGAAEPAPNDEDAPKPGLHKAPEISREMVAGWLEQYPDHVVVSYINCSAAVKALSDVICTSSNAVKIVKSFPRSQKIVFAPDQHLGRFVMKQADRPDLVLWPGTCIVHETFSERKIIELKVANANAEIIAHPECEEAVLRHADFIGSTSALLGHVKSSKAKTFIVATEAGILHKMSKEAPGKELIAAPPEDESCSCNLCPHMRRNTLEKVYLSLRDLEPQIHLDEALRVRALQPIERMLELSR